VGLWEGVPLKFNAKKFAVPRRKDSTPNPGYTFPKGGFLRRLFSR
jgi:hypothetical protein